MVKFISRRAAGDLFRNTAVLCNTQDDDAAMSCMDVQEAIRGYNRGFFTESEMQALVIGACLDMDLNHDDVPEIRKFILNNL